MKIAKKLTRKTLIERAAEYLLKTNKLRELAFVMKGYAKMLRFRSFVLISNS